MYHLVFERPTVIIGNETSCRRVFYSQEHEEGICRSQYANPL